MHISDCCQFSDIHILQGSVATYLRCGGIFKYEFVANLPVSLLVKEFRKSVNIWGSYGQEFSVLFLRQCMFRYDVGIEIGMPFLTQWLNSQMKKMLDGQKFTSDMEVQWVVHQWLAQQPTSFFCIRHPQTC